MNEQQELEFKLGEGEEPVDIDMGEDTAKVLKSVLIS